MRKTFKRATTLALAGVIAAGTFAVPAYADNATTIRVMVWDRGDAPSGGTVEDNAMTEWIQEQMLSLYNINVEYVSVARSNSDDVLNVMLAGGNAPDIVFTYDQAIFTNYAQLGGLTELSDYIAEYGDQITEYVGDVQNMGVVDGGQYAVISRRGEENPRHTAYIRQDWLDILGMDMPTTKEELIEYLYAVKEQNPGNVDNVIPWCMSGRTDTEKCYLNFVGSYVTFESERDEYIYNEGYIVVADGALDGLRVLNQLYNDGIIIQDFATDTTEDTHKAQMSAGNVGFVLDDCSQVVQPCIETLWNDTGETTFVAVECFDLEDGTYRNPFEPEYGMWVMIPAASEKVAAACVQYLNWLANPEIAENVAYSPEHTVDENGIPVAFTGDELLAMGYKSTLDDYNIVNKHFAWMDDAESCIANLINNSTFEEADWWEDFYEVKQEGKWRFPTYAYTSDAENTYGSTIKTSLIEYVYRLISCSTDEFDSLQETLYADLVNGGLQEILDSRAEYYDSLAE